MAGLCGGHVHPVKNEKEAGGVHLGFNACSSVLKASAAMPSVPCICSITPMRQLSTACCPLSSALAACLTC